MSRVVKAGFLGIVLMYASGDDANADWQFVLEWGGIGGVEDMAVDSGGLVHVLDRPNGRVVVFSPVGQYVGEHGGFNDPTGLAIDESDNIYVQQRCRVIRFTHDFQLLGSWESCIGQGDLQENRAIDVIDELIWVATVNDILKFSSDGVFLGRFMGTLGGTGIDAISDGTVWVTTEYNNVGLVRHYSADGVVLEEWNTILKDENSSTPLDLDVDSQNRIFISDGRIKIFTPDGAIKDLLTPKLGNYLVAELDGDTTLYVRKSSPVRVAKFTRTPLAVEGATWGRIKASIYGHD